MATIQSSHNSSVHTPLCSDVFVLNTIIQLTNILLVLPLSLLVLYLGFQRWRRQRSVPISHSDFLTYNLAIMELTGISGSLIILYSTINPVYLHAGICIFAFPWTGQMVFPVFTCVDRYLAVVHPITYMRLKHGGGMRIRLTSAGFVWLLCFSVVGFIFLMGQHPEQHYIIEICQIIFFVCFLSVTTFCCVSVLRTLIGPRPGEGPRERLRADKSKQKAFIIILITLVVLCLRLGGSLFTNMMKSFSRYNKTDQCEIESVMALWFNLPSSLVLPLLYLHRAMKIPGCKNNTESG